MGDVSGGRPFEVGVYVDAHLGIGEQARALEDAGFDHLWVYDSPLVFGDVYMAMLEAARATERIAIGPGVTQPLARPAVALQFVLERPHGSLPCEGLPSPEPIDLPSPAG